MKVLVACEFSGRVRDAFIKQWHDAISCDLLPTESEGPHYQGYLEDFIGGGKEWNLIVAFPPCTYLCSSGARWWKDRKKEQEQAIAFVMMIANRNCQKIAIENPIGILSTQWRKPDQIIQPWQFGYGETKATCLWLKNLSKLKSTNIVAGREARVHKMAPGKNRSKLRSITYQGVADAMAEQWG
ncbi:MAG: hypothetical protein JSW06_02320 [Thermoplasmatales archaeon]|nr:MAG: hypothetical protein JSW06_02320 [Thermoplasmatales archaeon]